MRKEAIFSSDKDKINTVQVQSIQKEVSSNALRREMRFTSAFAFFSAAISCTLSLCSLGAERYISNNSFISFWLSWAFLEAERQARVRTSRKATLLHETQEQYSLHLPYGTYMELSLASFSQGAQAENWKEACSGPWTEKSREVGWGGNTYCNRKQQTLHLCFSADPRQMKTAVTFINNLLL